MNVRADVVSREYTEYVRKDDDEADVRELMQAYIGVRSRRQRENGQTAPTNGNGNGGSYEMASGRRS